ncbi:aminotransferase class III-fold pyridoxal phosphate-dependent enzyme [Arthrobacter oryzae]|uniref:aminotransferase class III-fold pyridoxal phosphate-dependent enzyme n=1 Tax=Arthrobacter oryzae TaxID=409290 RepID=UPI0028662C26|nr:aminotransferase class III-fold pyridoxal phosphate-dependent enzyme [Arthrobacter oryzae]MDR6507616.1 4-aminobutyrate aminotransferase/(S)-3-amino-2-methylpropionate transaminase [Arthrobacter oryzae]
MITGNQLLPGFDQRRAVQGVPQERYLATEIPGPRSRELMVERRAHVSNGFGAQLPVFIDCADGGILLDVDGNRIVDFASGLGPTSLGASNERVRERLQAQLDRFTHTCFMTTEYESYVEVCRWLNRRAPGSKEKRTALFSTGAEANENAVKIARYFTGRSKVLAFDGAYHGRTHMTMSLTSKAHPYKTGFGPFSNDVIHVPVPTSPRASADAVELSLDCVRAALRENDPTSFAAMIIEPILGEAGCLIPQKGFLAGLREIADEHGILLIADEVQSGMGRTGRIWAIEYEDVVPDLLVAAKALANGMPLSSVTGAADVMNAVHPAGLGGTYAGNPLSCEAALAVFEQLDTDGVLDKATDLGRIAIEMLRPLVGGGHGVIDVRVRGAMIGIEFGDEATMEPASGRAKAVSAYCHANGVLALTNGVHENVIRLLPPIVIEPTLFRDGLQVIIDGIRNTAPKAISDDR